MNATKNPDPGNQKHVPGGEEAWLLALLAGANEIRLAELATCWRSLAESRRATSREFYCRLIQAMLDRDAPLLAFDVASAGLEHWPDDVELRRRAALALAKTGAALAANRRARALYEEGRRDEEVLGLLARTHKDLALDAEPGLLREQELKTACEFYEEAYRLTGGYWTGINLATLLTVRGDQERARIRAKEVRALCLQELDRLQRKGDDVYWLLAALGEAALNLQEWSEAEERYRQAGIVGAKRYQDLHSAGKQAELLLDYFQRDRAPVAQWLPMPRVVVFAGHMVDKPDRPDPRLPDDLTPAVYDDIVSQLKSYGNVVGYSSASCGSDILFQEAVQKLGGASYLVLPYDREEFARNSVSFAGASWRQRYGLVLDNAVDVIIVSPQQKLNWGSVSYDYANLVLTGLAIRHAQRLDTELTYLAVWDGKKGDGPGGTASIVERWHQRQQREVTIIRPTRIPAPGDSGPTRGGRLRLPRAEPFQRSAASGATEVRAILFADVKDFTKLTEEQMPAFVEHFLYMVGAMAAVSPHRPDVQESRGDGVFFIFDGVAKAGRFALDLCERLRRVDWRKCGLPPDLGVRMGLHAGPVYHYLCPFTKLLSYTGHHVSHAARIEPIALPGEVCASQAFVALASEEHVADFFCEYAGQVPLPKQYGTFPIYYVRWRRSRTMT